jgi:hypothetical protein
MEWVIAQRSLYKSVFYRFQQNDDKLNKITRNVNFKGIPVCPNRFNYLLRRSDD